MLGVHEYNPSDKFSVYPNPVNDILYLDFTGHQIQSAEIYDIKGTSCKFHKSGTFSTGKIEDKYVRPFERNLFFESES